MIFYQRFAAKPRCVFRVPKQEIEDVPKSLSRLATSCCERQQTDTVHRAKDLIEHVSHAMQILLTDLHENTSGVGQ